LLSFASPVLAQTFTWNNAAGGSYGSVSNWTPVGIPNSPGESALFNLPNTYNVTHQSGSTTSAGNLTVEAGQVTFASNGSVLASYSINDKTLLSGGDLLLDQAGGSGDVRLTTQVLEVQNGSTFTADQGTTVTVNDTLTIGDFPTNSHGTVRVLGGATLNANSTDAEAVVIGDNNPTLGKSTLEVSGSGSAFYTTTNVVVVIGKNGPGQLDALNGASVTLPGNDVQVGQNTFSSGITIDGGSTLSTFDISDQSWGVMRVYGEDIEVSGGSTFEPGTLLATGGSNITASGANTVFDAANLALEDFSHMTVSGSARLQLPISGGVDITGQSSLTVSGAGTIIEGFAEINLSGDSTTSRAKVRIDNGASWVPQAGFGTPFFGINVGSVTDSEGTVELDGAGTTLDTGDSAITLGAALDSSATLDISGGASATTSTLRAAIRDGSEAQITVLDSQLTATLGTRLAAEVVGGSLVDRGVVTLDILGDSLLDTGSELLIGSGATINLAGGELRVSDFGDTQINLGATVNWNNGKLHARQSTILSPDVANLFLPDGNLNFGQNLSIDGELALQSTLVLNGGTLTVLGVANASLLQLHSGRFEYLDDDLVIGATGPLGEVFELREGMTLFSDQDVIVEGTLIANGRVDSNLSTTTTGKIRVEQNKQLTATSALFNAGQIQLQGGRIDVGSSFNNSATGNLVGRGTVDAAGGITNNGDIALSNGQTDIFGDVTNQGSGRIIVSGNADVTFWGDVSHTGAAFNVSSGSSVTFFGDAGFSITGGGDVFFEADITPGSSPGLETFGGDVYFGALSTLEIEVAGTTPGDDYDRIEVEGVAHLGGTLKVELIDNGSGVYNPKLGDSFGFLASQGGAGGMFDTLDLPALDPGLQWMLNPGGVTLSLNVVAALEGDYNFDGVVDAGDYTAWRDALGQTGNGLAADGDLSGVVDEGDYIVWQANIGATAPAAIESPASQVPEPSTLLTLGIALLAATCKRAIPTISQLS